MGGPSKDISSGDCVDTIDIALGEQTTNEMCLEIFGIAVDAPAQPLLATDPVVLPNLRAIDMFVR